MFGKSKPTNKFCSNQQFLPSGRWKINDESHVVKNHLKTHPRKWPRFFGRWSSSLLKRWNFQVPAIVFWVEEPKLCHCWNRKIWDLKTPAFRFFFLDFFQQSNKNRPFETSDSRSDYGTLGGGWTRFWVSDKHGRICQQAHRLVHWSLPHPLRSARNSPQSNPMIRFILTWGCRSNTRFRG